MALLPLARSLAAAGAAINPAAAAPAAPAAAPAAPAAAAALRGRYQWEGPAGSEREKMKAGSSAPSATVGPNPKP